MRPRSTRFSLHALLFILLVSLFAFACSKPAPSAAPPPSDPAAPAPPPSDPAPPSEPPPPTATVDAGALDPKPAVELADCDTSKVRCRRMPPQCAEGQVATVAGSCFGECVAIERCKCSSSVACPQTDKYTCWHNEHCGPYVR